MLIDVKYGLSIVFYEDLQLCKKSRNRYIGVSVSNLIQYVLELVNKCWKPLVHYVEDLNYIKDVRE